MKICTKTSAILIFLDIFFILITAVCGILTKMRILSDIPDVLHIARDWSIPEIYNYFKFMGMIFIFISAYKKTKNAIFIALATFFAVLLMDDSLQIHEKAGRFMPELSSLHGGLHQALGEILFLLIIGAFSLGAIVLFWIKTPMDLRKRLIPLAYFFLGLVLCGVFLDFIHSLFSKGSWFGGIFLLMEDGGEMIFISLMLSYSIENFFKKPDHSS